MKICLCMLLLVSSLSLGQAGRDNGSYHGPDILGPVHIDRNIAIADMVARLGYSTEATETFCYRSPDGNSFLWFSRRAHDSNNVGVVFLSSFPNCINQPVKTASEDVRLWKTEKGIGLGGTAKQLIETHGKPSAEHKLTNNAYRWTIKGDYIVSQNRYRNVKRPELGESALAYGAQDDLRSAAFGIRAGRVVWILLSNSE